MLCQNCGEREANVKYTQIINGVKKEGMLCEECAKKLGIGSLNFNIPMHFSDFLGDFLDDYEEEFLPSFAKENNMCSYCGNKYEDFIKTGLLGCPECYDDFDTRLDPILKKLQGSCKHIGRGIKNTNSTYKEQPKDKKQENKDNKATLEEKLKLAIKEERYEDAAKIRDEIKKFNK